MLRMLPFKYVRFGKDQGMLLEAARVSQDSIALFWLFTLFVVFSGITLLNMLIGVLCQVLLVNGSHDPHLGEKMQTRIFFPYLSLFFV